MDNFLTYDPSRTIGDNLINKIKHGDHVVIIETNERAVVERVFKTSAFGPALLVVRLQTRRADGDPVAIVEETEVTTINHGASSQDRLAFESERPIGLVDPESRGREGLVPGSENSASADEQSAPASSPLIDAKAERAYRFSAQWLCRANEASEKGLKAKAEMYYQMSARHLMRYNDLVEKHGAKEIK
jgi:hypothetical protein